MQLNFLGKNKEKSLIPVVPEDQNIIKFSFDKSSISTASLASFSSISFNKSNKFSQPSAWPKHTILTSLLDANFDLCAPFLTFDDSSGVQIKIFATFKSSSWKTTMFQSNLIFLWLWQTLILPDYLTLIILFTCPAIVSSSNATSPVLVKAPRCHAANVER